MLPSLYKYDPFQIFNLSYSAFLFNIEIGFPAESCRISVDFSYTLSCSLPLIVVHYSNPNRKDVFRMEMNAAAIWINNTFAEFDVWMVQFIHRLHSLAGGFFTPFFEFISELGHGGIPLIILAMILMIFRRTRRYGTAMLLGLAIGAIFTNCILKVLIARPRPYSYETQAFFQNIYNESFDLFQRLWLRVGQNVESDKSFPSGHTTAAFASMTALFLTGNKKYSWLAFIFAILMAIARIYLVVHFASDVVAGIVVGILAGILGVWIAGLIPDGFYDSDWPFQKKKRAGGKHCSV